jgi:leader peptidase (prepilin peptidase)/N-methyltransferase
MDETLLTLIACVLGGLVVGSFLTVVVDRVPDGRSVVAPPSACGACGHRLTALDLVPLFSWLVLRGRCRHCGTPIGIEPVVMELTTVAVFVAMGLHFGWDPALPAFCVLGAALVALSWIDLHTHRLPREISYTGFLLGAPLLAVAALARDETWRIPQMLAGAVLALVLLGAVYLGSRGGFGDGDVRLAPLLGLYLGWQHLGTVPIGLFLGFLLGAVLGVVMMVVGRAGRRTQLPFGPFLAAGTLLAVFIGESLVDVIWRR